MRVCGEVEGFENAGHGACSASFRLLFQKQSGESILGYDKICWMNGFIHSVKNTLKVKIKYRKK